MKLGERVKQLRSQANWTLGELSTRCGKSISFLSDIEHGRGDPSISTLVAIAAAFDLSVSELLRGVKFDVA